MDSILSFGDWLIRRRTALNWTQHELAEAVHCSVSLIRKLEHNKRRPSPELISLLATKLELHSDYHAGFFEVARGNQAISVLPMPEYAHLQHGTSATILPRFKPPRLLTPLVGRDQELQQLKSLLVESSERLITVTGTGGVGKTHLVHSLLDTLANHFAHGIIWIDLAAIQELSLFPFLVARTMHLMHTTEAALRTAIQRLLAPAGTLLVLDNCEHLLPQLIPEILSLLSDCPQLRVLATSRQIFQVQAECVMRIEPLPIDDLATTLSYNQYLEQPAIKLFMECAARRGIIVETSFDNLQAIGTLVQTVEGLPLAIELAAARVGVFSPPMMVQQLDRLFDLLTVPLYGRPDRQQTLYRTLAWSYNLLTEAAQKVFRYLGFVDTSIDLATLAVLMNDAAPTDLAGYLEQLMAANMVLQADTATVQPRYTMLYPLRMFARDRLTAQEHEHLLQRYVAHMHVESAAARAEHVQGHAIDTWLEWFRHEQATLELVFTHLLAQHQVIASRLYIQVAYFWKLLGYFQEGAYWGSQLMQHMESFEQQLTLEADSVDDLSRVQEILLEAQYEYSIFERNFQKNASVIAILEPAAKRAEHYQLAVLQRKILPILGQAYINTKRQAEAQACYQTLLSFIKDHEYSTEAPSILFALGTLERISGNDPAAIDYYSQGLAYARTGGSILIRVSCILGLVAVYVDTGDLATADPLFEEGLELATQAQYHYGLGFLYGVRGRAAALRGNYIQAQQDLRSALLIEQKSGTGAHVANILRDLAYVLAHNGDLDSAGKFYHIAMQLHVQPTQATDILEQQLLEYVAQQLSPAEYDNWLHQEVSVLSAAEAIVFALSVLDAAA